MYPNVSFYCLLFYKNCTEKALELRMWSFSPSALLTFSASNPPDLHAVALQATFQNMNLTKVPNFEQNKSIKVIKFWHYGIFYFFFKIGKTSGWIKCDCERESRPIDQLYIRLYQNDAKFLHSLAYYTILQTTIVLHFCRIRPSF